MIELTLQLPEELAELDELERIEHLLVLLKAQIAAEGSPGH